MLDDLREHPRNPERLGWAQTGKLYVGGTLEPVKCQARFGEIAQFTVQVDADHTKLSNPATASIRTQVSMVLFTNGVGIRRVCDIVGGISLSGIAEAVDVIVNDASIVSGLIPVAAGTYYPCSISVGRYPRPATAVPPTLQGFNGSIGAGATQTVPIPAGSNSVIVYGRASSGMTMTQLDAAGNVVFSSDVPIGIFIPLAAGAATVAVTNPSGTPAATSVLYGIDA